MADDAPVSVTKITVPILYVVAMVGVIAGAVYAWDSTNDRISALETSAAFHVKLDMLNAEMKKIKLQRVHDKISEVQSAINFYDGIISTGGALTPPQAEGYSSRKAEMLDLQCELSVLNLGTGECD